MPLPRFGRLLLAVAACLACALADAAPRELKVGYYAKTCPGAEYVVREAMARALKREARSVASVMRLQFHDCFVNVSARSIDPSPSVPALRARA
jgi:peroxidase